MFMVKTSHRPNWITVLEQPVYMTHIVFTWEGDCSGNIVFIQNTLSYSLDAGNSEWLLWMSLVAFGNIEMTKWRTDFLECSTYCEFLSGNFISFS